MSKVLSLSTLADVTSLAATTNYSFEAFHNKNVCVQAVWTATTASFAVTLQYSADNTTWADFATATSISNASGSVMWDVGGSAKDAPYWRINVARTSGTLTTFKAYRVSNSR